MKHLKLHGFNNLTKTLSFNIYDICYARTLKHRSEYIAYIDEVYNAKRLTNILSDVVAIIGASILNIAYQDYDPQGASVTMLVAEEAMKTNQSETLVAHLDKSHISVHTYPESHPDNDISTFRVDIDVSTCGVISPLEALNYLIRQFDSDIVIIDYRVRGFTREVNGKKIYIDHRIDSIQQCLSDESRSNYHLVDLNFHQENIFHTKMLIKEFELDNYLFGTGIEDLCQEECAMVRRRLRHEMLEIFYGRNLTAEQIATPIASVDSA